MEKRCELCKYVTPKNKFFGGRKLLCSMQHREVAGESVCPEYVLDTNKLLQHVGFRSHEYGSQDFCYHCAHCKCTHGKMGAVYNCKRIGIQFWPEFSGMDYICDYYENGGLDAFTDRLADLIIERERNEKKGGNG